jgi:hypothetical protein
VDGNDERNTMSVAGGLGRADRLLEEWRTKVATIQRHLVDLALDHTFEAIEAGETGPSMRV